MNLVEQWIHRPQNVWLRKALFQVHLWTGLIVGLYVFAVCISGSAIVFRAQLSKTLFPGPKAVSISGPRLSPQELTQAALRAHPGYTVLRIDEAKRPDRATDILMERGNSQIQHQFDPYNGEDLGRTTPLSFALLNWLVDFHGNLQGGADGEKVNGVGGGCLAVLALTGAVIWWPGIQSWKRSLTIGWRGSWKQFNWGLHSAFGFWMLLLVFMWGFTGAYLAFPETFERTINRVSPLSIYQPLPPGGYAASIANKPQYPVGSWQRRLYGRTQLDSGEKLVRWMSLLHFGRFEGNGLMTAWVILGLMPPFLFVTGTIMWWNRVLSPYLRRVRLTAPPVTSLPSQQQIKSQTE